MKTIYLHTFKAIVTTLIVTMAFSCKDHFNDVQKLGVLENKPIGIAKDLNLKYTDSGKVVANLISSKMIDFSNKTYPYHEFPDGVILYVYDDKNAKSTIVADYAITYDKTNLIDLQGNVILTTEKKDTLFAQQLYFDKKKEWLFTNLPVKYKTGYDILEGNGFDSDKNFKKAEVTEFTGTLAVSQ